MSVVPCSGHPALRAWSLIAPRITRLAILAREDIEAHSTLFLAPDQNLQAVWLGPNPNFRSLTACWGWVGPGTEEGSGLSPAGWLQEAQGPSSAPQG